MSTTPKRAIVHVGALKTRAPNGTRYRGIVRSCRLACGHVEDLNQTDRRRGWTYCFDCQYGRCAKCRGRVPGHNQTRTDWPCRCDPATLPQNQTDLPERTWPAEMRKLEGQAEIQDQVRYADAARYMERLEREGKTLGSEL